MQRAINRTRDSVPGL